MKKSILILITAFIVLGTTSCKKYWTCTCDTTSTAIGSTLKTETIHTSKMTKKQAQNGPCAYTSSTSNNVQTMRTCKIQD